MMILIMMNDTFLGHNMSSETVVGCASAIVKTISLLARAAPNVKAKRFLMRTISSLNEWEYYLRCSLARASPLLAYCRRVILPVIIRTRESVAPNTELSKKKSVVSSSHCV